MGSCEVQMHMLAANFLPNQRLPLGEFRDFQKVTALSTASSIGFMACRRHMIHDERNGVLRSSYKNR